MGLETIKEINIDVSNKKYVTLNAKQYDRASRFILVSCCNQGAPFPIDKSCYAFVRVRKPDNLGVFNSCEITNDGKILVELTEQMLAFAGLSYADIVILKNLPVEEEITKNTAQLIESNNDKILSTMTFCIDISEAAFGNKSIASSCEFDALNDLLIKATEDYTYVMTACKISEDNAAVSETNAANSAAESLSYSQNSAASAVESSEYADNSANSASASAASAVESSEYMNASLGHSKVSEEWAFHAETSAQASASSAAEASQYLDDIKASLDESTDWATVSRSYAVGDTNTRDQEEIDNAKYYKELAESYAHGESGARTDEEVDNARYYYQQIHSIREDLNGAFSIKGTITFEELLALEEKNMGDLYTISDGFTTDDTFNGGAGFEYAAGTGVYYDVNGYWNCLTTHVSIYRNNVAKPEEVMAFLGI